MQDILALVLPLFGLIVLGYGTARIKPQPLEALGWLNTFIVYLALPALFFNLIAKTPVEKLASWQFILTQAWVTFAIFVLCVVLGLIFTRGNLAEATIQGLSGAYGNIGYMGTALAVLALGEQAAIPVALIICFENAMHFVMAPTLMAIARPQKGVSALGLMAAIAKKVFLHPFIVATIAGAVVAVLGLTIPTVIDRITGYLIQAAAPCALFAMGVTLALSPLTRLPIGLVYILPIKLVVHPVAMYFAMTAIGTIEPIWVSTAVLLASLPTATNVFVLAQQYGVWVQRASACVVLSTGLSVVTVSAVLYLVTTGQLAVAR